jgi:Zn-finger nucleic acid-binding protein
MAPANEVRACPACAQPMGPTTLEKVPLDRCLVHGVWLDPGELALTLEHAAERPVNLAPGQKRQMSLWHAIKMMFTETEAEKADREERERNMAPLTGGREP